jgi:hypothetical protein
VGVHLTKIYPQIPRILIDLIARLWTKDKKKPAISNGFFTSLDFPGLSLGGDEGDRTPGLGIANAALSQLSYIPILTFCGGSINDEVHGCQEFVGNVSQPLTSRRPFPILRRTGLIYRNTGKFNFTIPDHHKIFLLFMNETRNMPNEHFDNIKEAFKWQKSMPFFS